MKDLKERWFLRVNGKDIRVSVKFAETFDKAAEFAKEMKKKGYNYRIERISPSRRMSAFAGVPHGATYTVSYWYPRRRV